MIPCFQAILIALVTFSLLAQSPPKRKKVKDFGSTLKRWKWNPQKNAAEIRSDKKERILDEGDVIRIDTALVTSDLLVLDQKGNLLTGLTASEIEGLFADGTIHGGMLPKIGSALDAVKNGVASSHIIDGRVEHALLLEVLTNEGVGTMIRADAVKSAGSPAT